MKMLNKVLATILSLVMLLTVVPVSAFADGSSGQSGSSGNSGLSGQSGSSGSNMTVTLQVPASTGVGADGTVTLRLNAREMLNALRSDGDLPGAVIQLLKDMIESTSSDIITLNDILELIPVNNIFSLMLGENNENVPALIEQLGGMDAVSQMLDMEKLVLTANRDELIAFITSLSNLTSFIHTEAVFGLDIEFDLAAAYSYVDTTKLANKLEALTYDQLLALVGGDAANLKKIVNYDALMQALLDDNLIDLENAVKLDELKNNATIRAEVLEKIKADYESILTNAGIAKVQNQIVNSVDLNTITNADFKDGTLLELAKSVEGDDLITLITYLDRDGMLADEAVKAVILDAVKGMTQAEIENLLTDEAKLAYATATDPENFVFEWSHIKEDSAKALLEELVKDSNSGMQAHLSTYFDQTAFLNAYRTQLTAAVKADAEKYIKVKPTTTVYLKETVVDGIVSDAIAGLDQSIFTDEDYHQDKLTKLILEIAEQKNIDLLSYLKEGYNPFEAPGVSAKVMEHIDWDNVNDPAIIDRKSLLQTVLGTDGKITDLISEQNLSAYLATIDLTPVFAKITSGEVTLEQIVDVQALLAAISPSDYSNLIGLFSRNELIDQLMPQANTLVRKLTKEQIQNMVVPVLSSLIQNVDLVSLNGYAIAKEQADGDTAGLLAFNFREALALLASLIPTLEELAGTDGTILSLNLYTEYKTVGGQSRTKDININVVLEGDLAPLKQVAGKLAQYINVTRNGNQLSLELTVPAVLTEAYRKLLNSDRGAELKKELLALAGQDGAGLLEALEELTLDQILSLLSRVDVEALYSYVTNLSAVEVALEKIRSITGLNYSIETLQDLNAVLDAIANGGATLEAVCNAIERRVNVDVMAALREVADLGDRNQTVQAMLDRLCRAPGIGSYISKILDDQSLSEILEKYKNTDPIEAVSNYVAARINLNLREIIATQDANEIWQTAIERAAAYESYFNRAKNFALNMLDPDFVPQTEPQKLVKSLIPEQVLRRLLAASLADAYHGNGSFATPVLNLSIDTGYWGQKVLDRLSGLVSIDSSVRTIINNFLPQLELNLGLSVSIHFPGISQVTYLDENGDKLLTTYLASGVNPSVAITAPEVDGKDFLYWADANGNRVEAINGDVVLKAVYNIQTFVVSFTDEKGDLLQKYTVCKGDTVSEIPEVPTAEALGLYNGKYTLRWYLNGVEVTAEEILSTPVLADTTYVYKYTLEPENTFIDAGDKDVIVTKDANNNWTITVKSSDFQLTLNRSNGAPENMESLTIVAEGVRMVLDRAMLAQIIDNSKADSIICISSAFGKADAVSFENDFFKYETRDAYAFDLLIDGVAYKENFTGKFQITLSYAGALSETDKAKTSVYVLGANGAEAVNISTVPGVSVTFSAPHFSDYIVVNEYKISAEFTDGTTPMNGTLELDGKFVPAGAVIFSVKPMLSAANAYGNIIKSISYLDETGKQVKLDKIGDSMTMPACDVTITSLVGKQSYLTYYVVGNQSFTDRADAETYLEQHAELIPLGYRSVKGEWVGSNASMVQADVYLTPKYEPIVYTLTFRGVAQPVAFTVENYLSAFAIPAVPTLAGNTGVWDLSKTDPVELIRELAGKGVTTLNVNAVYTPRTYQVFFPNEVQNASFGSSVTVQISAKAGHTIQSVKVINMNDGTEVAMTDGSFTMPASNVRIEVTETPNTIHFGIVNRTNGNKQDFTAPFGTYATFTIQVPANSVLEAAPAIGKLVSFTVNQNGSKTMVFTFLVTEEFADGTEISYAIAAKVPATVRLANGLVTNEESPASSVQSLAFAGFAAPGEARFETVQYEFAKYTAPESTTSLLWLWILLAVVVLVGLIALFYNLYIRGKLKPNFLLRFVVFLVSIFFNICLGVSALVLAITQGTKKKEKIDFNAFGLANPEPENGAKEAVVMTPTEAVEADLAADLAAAREADARSEADEGNNAQAVSEDASADLTSAGINAPEQPAEEPVESDETSDAPSEQDSEDEKSKKSE